MKRQSVCLAVLVVDDDLASGMWLAMQIKVHGHKVSHVCSGIEALTLSEQQFFNLIMTDCYMAGMSGFELTQILRQRLATKNTMIVGMTASNSRVELNRGIAAGMDECLTKPLSKEKISKLIHDDRLQHIASLSNHTEKCHGMCPNIKNKKTYLRTMMPGFLDIPNRAVIKMNLEGSHSGTENIQLRKISVHASQGKRHHIEDISSSVWSSHIYKENAVVPQQAFLQAIWHTNGVDMRALEKAIALQDSTRVAHLAHKLRGIALVVGRADIADIADKVEKACQDMPIHALAQYAKKLRLSLVSFNQDIMVQLGYNKVPW